MSFFRLGCIELKGSFGPQPHFLNSHMSVLRSAQLNKLFGFRLRIYIRPERHFHHRSSLLEETVGNWKRQLTAGRDSKMTAFSRHHSWSKTNKIRFLSKHILFFRVVRCSRESVISAGTTPQDCFRDSHHHPLLVVWNLKEYDFFCALIASQRQWCSLTHALQFRSALTCSKNIQRRSPKSCRTFSKSNWIAQTLSNQIENVFQLVDF